jgi:hypothetical protein
MLGCAISTYHLRCTCFESNVNRMAAEHEQPARIDTAGAQIFTAALLNDGPDLESQPSFGHLEPIFRRNMLPTLCPQHAVISLQRRQLRLLLMASVA